MTTRVRPRRAVELPVRLLVVAALAVDAVVHLRLADAQQLAAPGGIGGGTLFRGQAVVAIVAGVLLLATGRRWAYVLAGLAALSALGPVLLYTYVAVPAIGPVPSMYDPGWHTAKVVSAVAEGAAVALAAVGVALTRPPPADSTPPADSPLPADSTLPRDTSRGTDSPLPRKNSS